MVCCFYLSNGEERVGDRNGGEKNDAGCIVVVVVVEPESAREDLEYVEGRQDLAEEEHKYGREMNANRVLAVKF